MSPEVESLPTDAAPVEIDARPARILAWSLRLFGGVDLLALVAVVMPARWMNIGHRMCGLGEFPAGPVPEYLARSVALLWAFHGALLWYLAGNVPVNAGVIRFVAAATAMAGLALLAIDLALGIPWWWTLLEGPAFAASGLWLLYWLRVSLRNPPPTR